MTHPAQAEALHCCGPLALGFAIVGVRHDLKLQELALSSL